MKADIRCKLNAR